MAYHDSGVSGNLRSQQLEALKQDYTQILSTIWKDEPIWKHIQSRKLTAAPGMVGEQYDQGSVRLMIVGRAVNGWEIDFGECPTLEATVHSVLYQENRLDEFAGKSIDQEDGSKYYYARSFFLRLMRKMVGEFHGTEENWQQRLIWSNLFKVAPRNGNNPPLLLVRDNMPQYRDILEQEMMMYRPDLVLFATDIGDFEHYKDSNRYESFGTLMKLCKVDVSTCEFVQAAGTFSRNSDVKVIVCCRPEGKVVDEMVKEIREIYSVL